MSLELLIGAIGVAATLLALMASLFYQAGRLSVRVEHLEAWRQEVRDDMHAIFAAIRAVEGLIRGKGE